MNQAQFSIKNNAAKLKKSLETDIPGEFRAVNRLVEQNGKNFKKFESQVNRTFDQTKAEAAT